MKKIILFLLILSTAQLKSECIFQEGEVFNYSVRLNFIKAGKSYIKIEDIQEIDGHSVYHIVSKTRTTGILDRMFHIREHMESWTDCDSLFTRRYFKDVDEVNYEKTFEANFNYPDSAAYLANGDTLALPGHVMDWLSMIYYFRTMVLYEGKEVSLTFFDNNKLKEYSASVVGREEIEVDAGKFTCWVIEPAEITKKNLKHKSELTIYLSVNSPNIPVKITSKAKFGTMILELRN